MKIFLKNYSEKFRRNKRAWYSFCILGILFSLSLMAEFIANDKPLLIYYKHSIYMPIFKSYQDVDFGGNLPITANYKDRFISASIQENGWMIWPPIPYHHETLQQSDIISSPAPPSWAHLLGTDEQGRDVVARLIYGVRSTLLFALVLTFVSACIGIIIGGIQGYFGGVVDLVGQRLMEIWSSIPVLITLMIISNLIEPNFWWLLGIMSMFKWMGFVPIVRAEFLRARSLNYVQAARAMGIPPFIIMKRHILPNVISAPLILVPFVLSGAITIMATLESLGFSLPSHLPSLGEIIYQGKNNLQAPWIILSGFLTLSCLLILIVFIGEGFRDTFQRKYQPDPELL